MRGGYVHHYRVPDVRVDPEDRCAAMLVYGRKIVVLPFNRQLADKEEVMELEGNDQVVLSCTRARYGFNSADPRPCSFSWSCVFWSRALFLHA